MGSNSDYYSANEGEKQARMDVELIHKTLTFSFGTSANVDQSQVTFSFGALTNTAPSHVVNGSVESTPQVVDFELPETTKHTAPHSVKPHRLTACEVNPLVHSQLSTSDLMVKHKFIEVAKSQYLYEELNSRKDRIHLAEKSNEKLCQAQEAQEQEITSLQIHISKQNTPHAFQQELLQKEQAM
ncbi:hypothetical protein PILCRDRAFT_93368 [Piloderma croceum F 1598]|uniref:Uncharacterized protein n=1 Tax=Piloderma croceum (strain F 1598) TaxID=765440 RepID=A0A0C3AFU3_PILCF|nr:hypothetical protein PILCRDRAFT_93368 [Piloderma croceum F 1598]